MTANITEICDGGPNPNTPPIEQMRASQEMGSKGKGTQSEDYAQMEAQFNIGTGVDAGPDKPSYAAPSNDEDVAEYD